MGLAWLGCVPLPSLSLFWSPVMNGKGSVRFSDLFADTLLTHGYDWAKAYYAEHGMSEGEFNTWFTGFCLNNC